MHQHKHQHQHQPQVHHHPTHTSSSSPRSVASGASAAGGEGRPAGRAAVRSLGINIRHPPDTGSTALMLAADKGNQPMVQGRLALGADCNVPELRLVRTSREAAEMINEEHTNSSEACHGRHGTALIRAVFHGHDGVTKALLAAGAEVDTVDCKGDAALSYAIYGQHRGALQALLAVGASPCRWSKPQLAKPVCAQSSGLQLGQCGGF